MRFPSTFTTSHRDHSNSRVAFLMLLMWLGGERLGNMHGHFGTGWSPGRISQIVSHISAWISQTWLHLVSFKGAKNHLLSPDQLQRYAQINHEKGCPREDCWGFIDGTLRRIARPVRCQENAYNGWKHLHALKYQFLTTPDGLVWVSGPEDGAVHDVYVLRASGLNEWLEIHSHTPEGQPLYLYGDSGYPNYPRIRSPYKGPNVTSSETASNREMSRYRITVEWTIDSVACLFPRLDNHRSQKALHGAISRDFHIACLLRNALTCVSGSETSQYYRTNAPSLQEYFNPDYRRCEGQG
ncbi:hypothetical protein IE53DRAFT_315297 [Violaceomyces palustris]|uniref:Uncharacterized protein n=1 Tax=Violaceomyces palustris TaxID=1673888 RepID=A0ACD0NXY1_9BASI|nr:hypothetical protein IE53DRAFT_315297 [Violaceomyces palustris]